MSSFTDARHQAIGGGRFLLISDDPEGMWFYIGRRQDRVGVLIPNGLITDGPSIPQWGKWCLGALGLLNWVQACLLKASVVHDRMRADPGFSLIEADVYFLVAMRADQKNWSGPVWARHVLREIAFVAVRTNRGRSSVKPNLS